MLLTLAGFGNLTAEKPKYLELGCEIARKKEKVIDSERKKSCKIHMQIMHLCLIGMFVLNVLENLANLGDLVVFSSSYVWSQLLLKCVCRSVVSWLAAL